MTTTQQFKRYEKKAMKVDSKVISGREPYISTLRHGDYTETFLTIHGEGCEDPLCMFDRMRERLQKLNSGIVRMEGVGLINTSGKAVSELRYCEDCRDCSLREPNHDGTRNCPVSGLYAHTISNAKLQPVWLGGQIVGTIYEDDFAHYCFLNNILPELNVLTEKQTEQVFNRFEAALKTVGMEFRDVIRTWFHLDNIFDWYDQFNDVRHRFFKERGIYDALVPASTGIGGANPAGVSIVGNLYAIKPKTDEMRIRAVPSPLQCPALEYGSSFSRAVEVDAPTYRKLFISGTASIAPEGHTIHLDDIDRQIELTLDVVLAIMESCGMEWNDVTDAIAYVRDKEDLPAFDRYCERTYLSAEPVVVIQNDVCREDLLFELELAAAKAKG